MPDRRFLVLHGWQNSRPRGHWQWQLTEALRASGEQVLYPQLPAPDAPSLTAWTALVRAELAQLGRGERIVVAHSLAGPTWAHVATLLEPSERVDRVLLVAPPRPDVLVGFPEVAEWAGVRLDAAALAAAAGTTRLVMSDDDPYSPGGPSPEWAALGLDLDLLRGAGHLDLGAGYGRWPAAEAWCRDPATRLTPR